MIKSPEPHTGIPYDEFLSQLSKKRQTRTYLEVGVSRGAVLKGIHTEVAVAVDPQFNIDCSVTENKNSLHLFQNTSDAFFMNQKIFEQIKRAPDLIFLDGLHQFEYLLRDFINAERISRAQTLIALHDCLPLNDIMTTRHISDWQAKTEIGSPYEKWWTGDVWKIVPILKRYRPELRIICVNCPPTGLVLITNLDPSCKELDRAYFTIVDEYINLPNSIDEIRKFYNSIEMIESAAILRDEDHSLYFGV